MYVEIHTLKDGTDQLAGVLRLQDGALAASPSDSRLLQSIIAEPLFDRVTGDVVMAEDAPERFLRLLRSQYTSAYLRASEPRKGKGASIKHAEPIARFAEACDEPSDLLEVPDVPQDDSSSCGAASAMVVANHFGTGPTNLAEWKKLLGTDPENGTPPESIVRVLRSLGLSAEPRQLMTLRDLRQCWQRGQPVIMPIQDYSPDAGPGEYESGHYVVFVGGPALGYVFVQDSMADVELEGANSDAAPGKVMIPVQRFKEVWHDRGADGRYYLRFGIVVGG